VVLILVVLIPTLGYLAILPPIELRIVEMSYEEPIIFGKPVGFHVLSYSLEYHNVGIVDATISGNLMIEIDGSRGFGQHAVMQPILLLRIGETQVWNVGLNPSDYIPIPSDATRFHLEVFAFLTINGMQRTLTAGYNYQRATIQQTTTQTTAQVEWKTIKTFTGSDNRDTEDFNVPTNYWRIVYTIEAESEQFAGFYAFVCLSGKDDSVASVSLNKSGTETSYIRAGPGDFWIKVLAANLKSWTIEVQIQQ